MKFKKTFVIELIFRDGSQLTTVLQADNLIYAMRELKIELHLYTYNVLKVKNNETGLVEYDLFNDYQELTDICVKVARNGRRVA